MKRTATQPDDIKRATDLIRRTGAMRADDVAKTCGWGRDYCRQVLDACRGIKPGRIDRLTHYMTPAEHSRRKREAERKRKARWAANRTKAAAAAVAPNRYDDVPECEDLLPRQVVVAAAYAPPLRTNAARSVFEWRPA